MLSISKPVTLASRAQFRHLCEKGFQVKGTPAVEMIMRHVHSPLGFAI
jgi:hypothetical protein